MKSVVRRLYRGTATMGCHNIISTDDEGACCLASYYGQTPMKNLVANFDSSSAL